MMYTKKTKREEAGNQKEKRQEGQGEGEVGGLC